MNSENADVLNGKKKLKWFQSRIENFNHAVPYQINLLNTFQNNIKKQYRLQNFMAVRQERISAERTIRNLKQMLIDIDKLKEQVEDDDHERYDKLIIQSVERISTALNHFNKFYESLSLGHNNVNRLDTICNDISTTKQPENISGQRQILLEIQEDAWNLENETEIAESMQKIEQDSQAINEIFHDLAKIINVQKEVVNKIEDNVEISHAEVAAAEKQLVQVAAKAKGSLYPLVGALLGTFVGGPVGFVAGLKCGTLVAVTGSVIGFSGGKILKVKQQRTQKKILNDLKDK